MTQQEKNWDGSTMRYVPYALRGLKPVTNEPWARDEAVYRRNDGACRPYQSSSPPPHRDP